MDNEANTEVKIEHIAYDIKKHYHSDLKNKDYDVAISSLMHTDGLISLAPPTDNKFSFICSDPDRVIAIAKMLIAAAEQAKKWTKDRA